MKRIRKLWICCIACFAYLLSCPMEARAELQPFYNLLVTIDRAADEGFNEKIEIYVTKNGEYYGDWDLNRYNNYLYQTAVQTGTYCFYARVRYDQTGTYQMEPEYQSLKISDIDYKEVHTVIFHVSGGQNLNEGDEGELHVNEAQEPQNPDNVYTIDRIDELREMQESAEAEASRAFQENEQWEHQNNFLAQNGIENQSGLAGSAASILEGHSYPEDESITEEAHLTDDPKQETEPYIESEGEEDGKGINIVSIAFIVLIVIVGAIGIKTALKRRE